MKSLNFLLDVLHVLNMIDVWMSEVLLLAIFWLNKENNKSINALYVERIINVCLVL
jgi:hypothetical protein